MLKINAITVRLGGRTILDQATAAIRPGSRVGLIGRNGAGKSTLMKVMIGQLEPDGRDPSRCRRRTKLGYIAQEAPSGSLPRRSTPSSPRMSSAARLMDEAASCTDLDRLGDLHDRLLAIDAYGAPARAARILLGLGFDEEMQPPSARQLLGRLEDARRAGGAAILRARRAAARRAVQPSRSRSDAVARKLPQELPRHPGRDQPRARSVEQCRRHTSSIWSAARSPSTPAATTTSSASARSAPRSSPPHRPSQDAQRARLQDYIARNSARASTAKQAQSRAKMLARMQPIAALAEDPSLSFDFPIPTELRPPLITLDMAAVGYAEHADASAGSICASTPTTASPCSGATATARPRSPACSPAQLKADGRRDERASGKMRVGYFTQYQVEELRRRRYSALST